MKRKRKNLNKPVLQPLCDEADNIKIDLAAHFD